MLPTLCSPSSRGRGHHLLLRRGPGPGRSLQAPPLALAAPGPGSHMSRRSLPGHELRLGRSTRLEHLQEKLSICRWEKITHSKCDRSQGRGGHDWAAEQQAGCSLLQGRRCLGASLVVQGLRTHCQGRGHGFDPWSGKIPRANQGCQPQLLRHATNAEARAPHQRSPQMRSWRTTAREQPPLNYRKPTRPQQRAQHSP